MSIYSVPVNKEPGRRIFQRGYYPIGIIAGIGLLMILPGKARAERNDHSYGHAEITLGFPNGQVTVGKTWDNHPREVVVEEVTHRYPENENDRWDRDRQDRDRDRDYNDDDEDDVDQVIIEKRVAPCRPKKVVIIERYVEPRYCEPRRVIRRSYVQPNCRRPEVVIYRQPEHVIHRQQERVIYQQPERVVYVPSHHSRPDMHDDRGSTPKVIVVPPRGGSYNHGNGGSSGPRNLFPEDQGRPMRSRGVQKQVALVGG